MVSSKIKRKAACKVYAPLGEPWAFCAAASFASTLVRDYRNYIRLYWDYIGVVEKTMETTI